MQSLNHTFSLTSLLSRFATSFHSCPLPFPPSQRTPFLHIIQGFHTSLKVLQFFSAKFKALKVLENRTGTWRYLNFIPQVLESPWIRQSAISLNNICVGLVAVSASGFVKLIYWHTSCCSYVSCLQHGLSICQVFCLTQDLLIVVMFCFY